MDERTLLVSRYPLMLMGCSSQARESNRLPTSQGEEHADAALLGDIRGNGLLVQVREFCAKTAELELELRLRVRCQHAVCEVERLVFGFKGTGDEVGESLLREVSADRAILDPIEVALGATTNSIAGKQFNETHPIENSQALDRFQFRNTVEAQDIGQRPVVER